MNGLEKQTLTELRSTLRNGKPWAGYLCPSKTDPSSEHSIFFSFTPGDINIELGKQTSRLDSLINSFAYHRCSNPLGRRVHYYRMVNQ